MLVLDDLKTEIARLAQPLVPGGTAFLAFAAALRERKVAKGELLARAGEASETLFFVRHGTVRYYYLADGTEHTGQFFGPRSFVADVNAFTTGAPALQNIDALEPSTIVYIPKSALAAAYDADHAFERFGRRLMESAMSGAQRRSASLLMRTPEERYLEFVRSRSDLSDKVPQYLIASFLGVTPESLSRLRKRRA